MAQTFYFYDLETTGINSRGGRIMQFGGQRTNMDLESVGEPDDILVRLSDDVLPEPEAIMITGITPQATQAEGITEAEFLRYFQSHVATRNTIFVGFNNIRFDDEFIRHTLYRNFYDAYEWAWQDGRSRWDLLDVVRMTRALRPEDISWPIGPDGKASNRLELLTSNNGLDHANAHDALSDVKATIVLAGLLKQKQPRLFSFLLSMRDKKKVQELIAGSKPFVYTSGKYPGVYDKTTIAMSLGEHPGKQGVLVYDLRHNPSIFNNMSPEVIASLWQKREEDETKRFPIKTMQFNRCPAVAPLGVLNDENKTRLQLDMEAINQHRKAIIGMKDLYGKLIKALEIMDEQRKEKYPTDSSDVDSLLYDGFFSDTDKTTMGVVRAADKSDLAAIQPNFKDKRLQALFPLYKARNFPQSLSSEERELWEKYRYQKLMSGGVDSALSKYFMKISEISKKPDLTENQKYLLEELQLYGESIMPEPIEDEVN